MEKNMNKVRHIPYGRKKVYFDDVKKVSRFVNLYKDLFVLTSWANNRKEGFFVNELDTDKGTIYELVFLMNHDDMREIEKVIPFKRKSFVKHFDFYGDEKYVVKYFVS